MLLELMLMMVVRCGFKVLPLYRNKWNILVRQGHPVRATLNSIEITPAEIAADDGSGEPGHLERRLASPPVVPGGDDHPGHPHGERLGEGILDRHPADSHGQPISIGASRSPRTGTLSNATVP